MCALEGKNEMIVIGVPIDETHWATAKSPFPGAEGMYLKAEREASESHKCLDRTRAQPESLNCCGHLCHTEGHQAYLKR